MTTTDDGGEATSIDDDYSFAGESGGSPSAGSERDGSEAAVINHLLEVEKEAQALIADADAEAARRTGEYKAKAEAAFKEAHDALVYEIDVSYKVQTDDIQKAHDEQIEVYKQVISSIPPDRAAFNAVVEKALVGECALSGLPSSEAYRGNRTMETI